MTRKAIDLNADLGEGEPHDELLLSIVSSCNIACGGHAGDAASMTRTVRLADRHGVTLGAHPSYPDREGFGRRSHFMNGGALLESLTQQIESLAAICKQESVVLSTLKPHGALYNDARASDELAAMLVQLAAQFGLRLIGLPGSATQQAAEQNGVGFLAEGFVDRAYLADGSLCPRDRSGAVFDDISIAADQALRLAKGRSVSSIDGEAIHIDVDTLCLHGDTPNAEKTARAVQSQLAEAGISIQAPGHA